MTVLTLLGFKSMVAGLCLTNKAKNAHISFKIR